MDHASSRLRHRNSTSGQSRPTHVVSTESPEHHYSTRACQSSSACSTRSSSRRERLFRSCLAFRFQVDERQPDCVAGMIDRLVEGVAFGDATGQRRHNLRESAINEIKFQRSLTVRSTDMMMTLRVLTEGSGGRDSNPRQPAWKAGTLPTELPPQWPRKCTRPARAGTTGAFARRGRALTAAGRAGQSRPGVADFGVRTATARHFALSLVFHPDGARPLGARIGSG